MVGDATGWALTAYKTLGLIWVIGLEAVAYIAAMRLAGPPHPTGHRRR